MIKDEFAGSSLPMDNTVLEVVDFLKSEGHEVEEFPMKDLSDLLIVIQKQFIFIYFFRIILKYVSHNQR